MQQEISSPDLTIIEKEGFVLIPHWLLVIYHKDFINRHDLLRKEFTEFDFRMDHYEPITVSINFLKKLIDGAEDDEYLVAQYLANDDLSKMDIALCIKQKRLGDQIDDIVKGDIYNAQGDPLDYYKDFLPGHINYLKRKTRIYHASRSNASAARWYDFDREGRAHKITGRMREIVDNLNRRQINFLAYFILDDYNKSGFKQLSVAFSDTRIEDGSNTIWTDKDAYDHGTACCPIG